MASSTRSTRKPLDLERKTKNAVQQPENKWIWIMKDSIDHSPLEKETEDFGHVITLRHPSSGMPTLFLFRDCDNTVQEIFTCEDKKRSWFIDEYVKSDGRLKLSTPIDPIFLVLPYLKKSCSTQAIPMDQLLSDEEFPQTELLLKCTALKTLGLVADQKGTEDMQAFKYNEDKVLRWLQKKAEKVVSVLEKRNIGGISNGIASTTFTKSTRDSNPNSDKLNYLKYAHGIISDYIEPELSKKLLKQLDLPEEQPTVNLKRKSSSTNPEIKKAKVEANANISCNTNDSKKGKEKLVKQSAKGKLLAKAASGNKSIASFFKKS